MTAPRFSAVPAAIALLTAGLLFGAPSANATSDDDFLKIVSELGVPTNSPADAVQIGHDICNAVEAGQLQPGSTVRGVVSRLMAQGLEKGQAVHLVWGAVSVYCPRYTPLVGR